MKYDCWNPSICQEWAIRQQDGLLDSTMFTLIYFANKPYSVGAFTFSSKTNTSHRAVRQHSCRHSVRSCCSTESTNLAPSFFESSVRMILSSCTSNLLAQPSAVEVSAATVAATTAAAAYTMRRRHHDDVAIAPATDAIVLTVRRTGGRRTVR